MIVKNAASSIEKCLRSFAGHVDRLAITDTGSTDQTWQIIEKLGLPFLRIDFLPGEHSDAFIWDSGYDWDRMLPGLGEGRTNEIFLADFARARQTGWNQAQSDFIFWIDADDVVFAADKLRPLVEKMSTEAFNACMLPYEYAYDGAGNVRTLLWRERIVRRSASRYSWKGKVHESLGPISDWTSSPFPLVKHQRQFLEPPRVRFRNLKILLLEEHRRALDGAKLEPRELFYLGIELMLYGERRPEACEQAIARFDEYLRVSTWNVERALASLYLGQMHARLGRKLEASRSFALAAEEDPDNPDALFALADLAYKDGQFDLCVKRGKQALRKSKLRPSAPSLMHDPHGRATCALIGLAQSLVQLDRTKEAAQICDEALAKIGSSDEPCRKSFEQIRTYALAAAEERSMDKPVSLKFDLNVPLDQPMPEVPLDVLAWMSLRLWKECLEAGHLAGAVALLDSLPARIAKHPRVADARSYTQDRMAGRPSIEEAQPGSATLPPPKIAGGASGRLSIAVYTGPAWEPWGPESPQLTGIGGSETAAICMSRELARLGHQVTVVGDCEGKETRTAEGVSYIDWRPLHGGKTEIDCDVLVISRAPWAFELPMRARRKYLWVHDVNVGEGSPETTARLGQFDRILCLSKWHRQFFLDSYPGLDGSRVAITRNGIDVERFAAEPLKRGNRLHWSSSPDRGLDRLIELFPKIRKEVPDAEIHVYYGFDTWEQIARRRDPSSVGYVQNYRKFVSSLESQGIFYHGRQSQQRIAESLLASKLWAYPTWFTETSCITAMEAQAAGCVPVTSRIAALGETVVHGVLFDAPSTTALYADTFTRRVITLLKDEEARLRYAVPGRKYALESLSWTKVAAEWHKMFLEALV